MKHTPLFPALAAVAALALACSDKASGPGQLSVSLKAAAPSAPALAGPPPAVSAIWVDVTLVRAHSAEGGWVTLDTAPARVNLLAIADAGIDLGLADLPAGQVTQLRLVVDPAGDNVVVTDGGVELPLVVPSGSQSGIKIHGPWDIDSCEETTVTLELDGHRSIWAHPTGSGEEWILRPVIRAVATQGPGTCEPPAACVPAECPSGLCEASGDRCAPGGTGDACDADAACLSNFCVESSCAPGGEESPCREPEDCADGLACVEGACAPATPPL
jgi:hypothetical protein